MFLFRFFLYTTIYQTHTRRLAPRVTVRTHKKRSAGINCLAYPVYRGSRIAYQLKISNVRAHAVMKYYRITMYITHMDAGHCVIVQLVVNLRDSVHRRLTSLTQRLSNMSVVRHYLSVPDV